MAYSSGQLNDQGSYSSGDQTLDIVQDFDMRKKRRGNLPKQVTDMLRQWYAEHQMHPYPSEDEKQQLMSVTGLTMAQTDKQLVHQCKKTYAKDIP
ncbi:MAG: hypothetical protein M1824_002139 [Vezdaea acicularis]|nr:MAG: hypothetical protein M1824_002139 [Vezdaea acicularis]